MRTAAEHTGGTPPLGYDVDADGHLVINEREAEAVRMIYTLYLDGPRIYSYYISIEQRRIILPKEDSLRKNSLYEILKNEKYTGCYIYNRTCSATRNGSVTDTSINQMMR